MRELIKKLTPGFLKELYRKFRYRIIRLEFGLFGLFAIQKKRVVLCNVWGYGDNPKWIARALHAKDKSLELIFVTDLSRVNHRTPGIRYVETNSVKAVFYLATAHIWVDCNRKEPYITKREGQIYFQTWHGGLPLKKIEKDCETLGEAYLANAARDSRMADVFLSNGDFCSEMFRRAFMYDGEIAVTGSARLDPLLHPSHLRVKRMRSAVAEMLGTDSTQAPGDETAEDDKRVRIAVYAPTFRDNGGEAFRNGLDLAKLTDVLQERFGGNFGLLVRLHPLDRAKYDLPEDNRILDAGQFEDIYEILEAADVLITDYSNTCFEFAYTGKPVFLYAPDVEGYGKERGFYFDYASLPYPHAAEAEELYDAIRKYDPSEYRGAQQKFFLEQGVREDGMAGKRIADLIIKRVYR